MLRCEIAGSEKSKATLRLADLEKQFKKLTSVASVQAKGAMNGNFYFIFDQEAFFTIAGTLIALPEENILQNRKECTLQAAAELGDATGELGNLLVGSWNRVFGKESEGHGHFSLNKNFIGNPWNHPEEAIGLTSASHLQVISYEVKVKEFAPVTCAVVYPKELFEPKLARLETQESENASAAERMPQMKMAESQPVDESLEPAAGQIGEVSESIRKMTSSPAILPGQPGGNAQNTTQYISQKSVQDVMRKDFIWAGPDETVAQGLAKLKQNNIDYMLVGENGILEGVVSKADIRGAVSPYLYKKFSQWRRPIDDATLQIRLKWIMTRSVRTIKPLTSVADVMEEMRQSVGEADQPDDLHVVAERTGAGSIQGGNQA